MKHLLPWCFALFACLFSAAQTTSNNPAQARSGKPHITNGPVAEYVSDSACTVGWSTTGPGKMSVRYGTDRDKMSQTIDAVDSENASNHHAQLTGLKPSTQYFFQVMVDGVPLGNAGTFQTVGSGEPPIKSKAVIPQ